MVDQSTIALTQQSNIWLDELSDLASRSFASSREALRAILDSASGITGMRTAFLTQMAPGHDRLRVLAAYNAPGGCRITAGSALPAQPPFADRKVWSMSPVPLLVSDMHKEAGLAVLQSEFPNVCSYIGVPVVLSGGRLFGTLCAADPEAHSLQPQQAGALSVLARIAAGYIETEQHGLARRQAEETLELAQGAQQPRPTGRTAELVEERGRLEQRWRALMIASPDGIAVANLGNNVLLCNEQLAILAGANSPDELIGRNAFDFVAPEDRSLATINMQRSLELGIVRHAEYSLLRKDGSRARAELSTSVILDGRGRPNGFVYVIRDITARLRAEERLNRHFERLSALRNIDMAITVSHDLRVTLNVILYQVAAQLRAHAADVLLLDPETQMLEYAAGRGFSSDAIARTRLLLGEGHPGRAATERRLVAVADLAGVSDFLQADLVEGEDFVAYFAMPLQAKGQIEGVLEIYHREPLQPDAEWLDFLEALAGQAAIAIDNARMFEDLQRSNIELAMAYDTTLEGWSRALDLRDRETEGHTRRVTEQAVKLARRLGLSEGDLVHLRRGALLHDIGKMGIPDGILLKPGPLTDDEWRIMKRHPEYAYDMLSPIPFLRQALDIPYCHHEKWDGSGYPRGLAGEEIPLAARIFAVVDVSDALLSTREYHAPWPKDKVLEHIRNLSGQHFDPDIVAAFLEMKAHEDLEALGLES